MPRRTRVEEVKDEEVKDEEVKDEEVKDEEVKDEVSKKEYFEGKLIVNTLGNKVVGGRNYKIILCEDGCTYDLPLE